MEHLGNENGRRRHADRSKSDQTPNLVALWKGTRFVIESCLAIGFDLRDLIADKLIMPDHAYNVATQERWQRPTITGDYCIEPTEQPFSNSLAAKPNAVQSEQPLDSADDDLRHQLSSGERLPVRPPVEQTQRPTSIC